MMKFNPVAYLFVLLFPLLALGQGFLNTTQTFYTRTHLLEGNRDYGNLYAQTYHTGAGQSAVVLITNRTVSLQSYIYNGTRLNVRRSQDFPWGWWAGAPAYASWGEVGVNAGLPTGGEGFSLVSSGKRTVVAWNNGKRWLVCKWWYEVPQLFWIVDYRVGNPGIKEVPKDCAIVELAVEWI